MPLEMSTRLNGRLQAIFYMGYIKKGVRNVWFQ